MTQPRFLFQIVLAFTLLIAACTPIRGGGGGGGGDGDDDEEPGLFAYRYTDYYDGYYYATLLLPLEDGYGCGNVDEYAYMYDSDYNFLRASVYRGSSKSWEGDYDYIYDSDCGMEDYDYANLQCWYGEYSRDGDHVYVDAGDALSIDSFSSSNVRGQVRVGGDSYDFRVTNCGEYSYDDRGERSYDGAPPEEAASPRGTTRPASWKLRFR